jgi:hypothetical protein
MAHRELRPRGLMVRDGAFSRIERIARVGKIRSCQKWTDRNIMGAVVTRLCWFTRLA